MNRPASSMCDLYGGAPNEVLSDDGVFASRSALVWYVNDGFSGLMKLPVWRTQRPPNFTKWRPAPRLNFCSTLYVLPPVSRISDRAVPNEPATLNAGIR